MPQSPCPECSPTHQLNHRNEWFGSVLNEWSERSIKLLIPDGVNRMMQRVVVGSLLGALRTTRLLKEQPFRDVFHIHQRTRVIEQEARQRGMTVRVLTLFGRPTNLFVLRHGTTTHLFEGLPGLDPRTLITRIDDKEETRNVLNQLNVPTPQGVSVHTVQRALAFAQQHGFPLVVKPRSGSLSAHTTVNIGTEEELQRAFTSAQQMSRSVIVEEYIPEHLFRATTVGPRLVACGRREPPMITGDGVHTVQELFEQRDDERRALLVALGYTPENIPPLPLNHLRIPLDTVLPNGAREALTWKVNLAYGAGVVDVTDDVHPDNRALFEKIATAVKLPSVGIDFLAPSIAVSWKEQKCGVIELNSLPSIDLHHPPVVTGVNRNVAGALLDYVTAQMVHKE